MEAIYVIATIIIFAGGVITGIYVNSQIENSINNNIKRNGEKKKIKQ